MFKHLHNNNKNERLKKHVIFPLQLIIPTKFKNNLLINHSNYFNI